MTALQEKELRTHSGIVRIILRLSSLRIWYCTLKQKKGEGNTL